MKEPLLDLHLSKGLGDTICSTPSLRKLFFAYGKKISVLTDHPYIFKNNKYVDKIFNKIIEIILTDYIIKVKESQIEDFY